MTRFVSINVLSWRWQFLEHVTSIPLFDRDQPRIALSTSHLIGLTTPSPFPLEPNMKAISGKRNHAVAKTLFTLVAEWILSVECKCQTASRQPSLFWAGQINPLTMGDQALQTKSTGPKNPSEKRRRICFPICVREKMRQRAILRWKKNVQAWRLTDKKMMNWGMQSVIEIVKITGTCQEDVTFFVEKYPNFRDSQEATKRAK